MIGTLDSQIIEKFKEFQDKTEKYLDLDIDNIQFDNISLSNDAYFEFIKGKNKYIQKYITKHPGKYPILGSSLKNECIANYIQPIDMSDVVDKPCVSFNKDNAKGSIPYYRNYPFLMDRHHIAILCSDNILPQYLYYSLIIYFKKSQFGWGENVASTEEVSKHFVSVPIDLNEQYKSIDIQKAIVEFLEFWKINYTDDFRQIVTHQKPILEKIKKALISATFRHNKTIVTSFNEFAKSNNYKIKLEEVTFKKIDFFNIKRNDLLLPKKLEKNQDLILQYSSDNGYPVYSGAIEPLCKVDESKYPNKIFVPNHQNPDISFANNGDGSAGRNFFVHTDKYFVNQERTVISFKNDNDFYSLYILHQIINMRDKYNMNRDNRPTPKDLPKFGIEITLPSHNTVSLFDLQKKLVEFWEMTLNDINERFIRFDNIERLTDKIDEAFLYRTFSKVEWR